MGRQSILALAALIAVAYFWSERLLVVNDAGRGIVMVNKWTGTVQFCQPEQCYYEPKAERASSGNPKDGPWTKYKAIPPLPPGVTLDQPRAKAAAPIPPPPKGFVLDK